MVKKSIIFFVFYFCISFVSASYDLNNDDNVDISDLLIMLDYYIDFNQNGIYRSEVDYNQDIKINILDFLIMIDHFGEIQISCNYNGECENFLGEFYNSCQDCPYNIRDHPFILFNNDLITQTINNLDTNPYWEEFEYKHVGSYTNWKIRQLSDFEIDFVSDSYEGNFAVIITDFNSELNNFIYQNAYLEDTSNDYELRFVTKSDSVTSNRIRIQQFNGWEWLKEKSCWITVSNEWTQHTCSLSSEEFHENFEYLRINIPAGYNQEGSSYFDNIELVKSSNGENMISGGDFENPYRISEESIRKLGSVWDLKTTALSFIAFHKIIEEDKIYNINKIIDELLSYPFDYSGGTSGFHQRAKLFVLGVIYDSYYEEIDYVKKEDLRREISGLIEYLNSVLDSESKWFLETENPRISAGHPIHAREIALPGLLAVYGDCTFEENCTKNLNALVNIYENHYNPYQNYVYDKGGHHIGFTYSGYQNFDPVYYWDSAVIGRSWLSEEMNDLQLSRIYALQYEPFVYKPYGEYPTFGDSYNRRSNKEFTNNFPRILYFFDNPYVNNFIQQYSKNNVKEYSETELINFLFYHDTIKNKPRSSFDTLPLSFNTGNSGFVIMRDDFDFVDDTTLVFKSSRYHVAGHNHRDLNSFTLYYKAPLLIDTGEYGGTTGTDHMKNYMTRTIAHNALLVYDPEEDFGSFLNDGGQKNYPDYFNDLEDLQNERFVEGIIKYYDDETLTYTVGDATNAYSEKVASYNRSVLFLRDFSPPIIIIKDDIKYGKPGLDAKILYHSINRPQQDNNEFLIYESGGEVLISTFGEGLSYEIIGGTGFEYYYDGINHVPDSDYRNIRPEAGKWRIEITSTTNDESETMYSILEVADRFTSGNKSIEQINNGFLIEDIAILFVDKESQEFEFSNPHNKIILVGIPRTYYEIIETGNTIIVNPNIGSTMSNDEGLIIE